MSLAIAPLLALAFGLPVLGGLAAVFLGQHSRSAHAVGTWTLVGGAVAGLALAATAISLHTPTLLVIRGPVPEHPFSFRLDPLAGVFLGLIFGLAGLSAIYGRAYASHGIAPAALGLQDFCLSVFVVSMGCVVAANDVITFLAGWELMTVAAFLLIPYEHSRREVRRAAYLFLVASQMGTAFILVAFLLLAHHGGSISFDAFRAAAPLAPWARGLIFALALIGFGTKAGVIPLHVWLPLAHPVAPSHVSALMSGVMIKTAIYGLIRFGFEFLAPLEPRWGLVVLAVGTVSAFLGVLFALMEHDLKRLLAYHSVENIGIILMGIGAALFFAGQGRRELAIYALSAGLFHTINHAIFKALLFLGAGAVLHATGERNMEELGGLMRRMPHTGLCFLIGAMAIAGLPPLNGFASEWMTYRGLFALSGAGDSVARLLGPLTAATLAAVGGLAAACFAKAFGVTFLGLCRSSPAQEASEVPASMVAPQGVLALLCCILGLFPGLVLPVVARAFPGWVPGSAGPWLSFSPLMLPGEMESGMAVSPVGLLAAMGLAFVVGRLAWRKWGVAPVQPRTGIAWACGYPVPTARAQYSATSFAQPFAHLFGRLFSRRKMLEVSARRSHCQYLPESISLRIHTSSPFDRLVYDPIQRLIIHLSRLVARIQAGSLQLYLGTMLVALVGILLIAP